MSTERFADDPVARGLVYRLYADVGAFFCPTRRGAPQICFVCTGPANTTNDPPLCSQCRDARTEQGSSLADLVATLAYAKGRMPSMHQSAHHVRAYKALSPAPRCAQDLGLMAGAATYLHGGAAGRQRAFVAVIITTGANLGVDASGSPAGFTTSASPNVFRTVSRTSTPVHLATER